MNFNKLIDYFHLDKQEFLFQFNSHPNYPSALAFSDTLNFMGLKNDAYELDKEYWDELPDEFIAIVDNAFSLVKKSGNSYDVYSEDLKNLTKEQLYNKTTNFVILFEKTDRIDKRHSPISKSLLYIIFFLFIAYSIFQLDWYYAVFNILSVFGVYISLEIFNEKFGGTSTIVGNICGSHEASQSTNSCNKIINQDKMDIFGLKFSDLSLIYFLGLSILGILFPATSFVILGLSTLSVVAIGYSIYIQAFIEKTFCKICLIIITILITQLIIGTVFFKVGDIVYQVLFLSFILLLIPFTAILYINNILKEKESLQKSNTKNLRFKRNYDLFKNELYRKEKIHFKTTEPFFIGDKNAKLHISIISNPYCGFCKDAHKIIENLLEKYPNDISTQLRFNYFPENADEKYTALLKDFANIYKNKTEKEFLSAVEKWYDTRNEAKIHQMSTGDSMDENLSVLTQISQENLAAGLSFTPVIIINGHQFPDFYDREDIFYFIEELIEDEDNK